MAGYEVPRKIFRLVFEEHPGLEIDIQEMPLGMLFGHASAGGCRLPHQRLFSGSSGGLCESLYSLDATMDRERSRAVADATE